MENIMEKIDQLFAENKGEEAKELMLQGIEEAKSVEDDTQLISLLNEIIGYCRETSQVELSYKYAEEAIFLLKKMGLEGTIPYATTLLNIANAYRAGGNLDGSLVCYEKVKQIYNNKLEKDHMLFASFYNNLSLLYQEMKEYKKAKECLIKALSIVEKKEDSVFEIAVTYANLASSALQLEEKEEAKKYFEKAIVIFEENGITDTHYQAALSAVALFHYKEKEYEVAKEYYRRAMVGIEKHLGKNEFYYRMKENMEICNQAAGFVEKKGVELCKEYFLSVGKPLLEKNFTHILDKIEVGVVGEGSDCFGFDDEISKDHDWGPSFCIFLNKEQYEEYGETLKKVYESLPSTYEGQEMKISAQGKGRRGVQEITEFYQRILGNSFSYVKKDGEIKLSICWEEIPDYAMATATNGEMFWENDGEFTTLRRMLKENYPEKLRFLKIAENVAKISQNLQYNYERMKKRKDMASANLMLAEGIKESLKLLYYLGKEFPPHDKWLIEGLKEKEANIILLVEEIMSFEELRIEKSLPLFLQQISEKLCTSQLISQYYSYLEDAIEELLYKASLCDKDNEILIEEIVKIEFEAFDQVKNLGGRADCQDDWFTFSIMRKSQYLTWNREMLIQYHYEFSNQLQLGRNLIEEKYGRMMKNTAKEEYEKIKIYFPNLDKKKEAIIENIVAIQVGWMEDFAKAFPELGKNTRSIRSCEDTILNTSYETYLRGELGTYSDLLLKLYGEYLVSFAREGKNLAKEIMKNSVILYGYISLEEAEKALHKSST